MVSEPRKQECQNIMSKIFFLAIFSIAISSQCVHAEWRWNGKVAVVTGASAGIGEEIALQLANKGMIVAALARRESKLEGLVNKTTGKIHPVRCDLSEEKDIIEAFKWIEKNLGGVDVLVNNAGSFISSPLINGSTSDWKAMLDLNVLGTSICSREALKTMRKRGDDGQIININSLAGHFVVRFPGLANGIYTATKYGVTALSEVLNNELSDAGSKIKVSSVSPGLVLTELVEKSYGPGNVPPYHIDVDDIADAVIYVLSTKPKVRISELTIHHR